VAMTWSTPFGAGWDSLDLKAPGPAEEFGRRRRARVSSALPGEPARQHPAEVPSRALHGNGCCRGLLGGRTAGITSFAKGEHREDNSWPPLLSLLRRWEKGSSKSRTSASTPTFRPGVPSTREPDSSGALSGQVRRPRPCRPPYCLAARHPSCFIRGGRGARRV
jgi:hypothetical protein